MMTTESVSPQAQVTMELNIDTYFEKETDERGELPARLNRGVLSEDGLYNLLQDPVLAKLLEQN